MFFYENIHDNSDFSTYLHSQWISLCITGNNIYLLSSFMETKKTHEWYYTVKGTNDEVNE